MHCETSTTKRIPWNKGKLTGAKPRSDKTLWAIRTKLQIDQQVRDLALFNLAIDSKLRGCDVVALKVDEIAPMAMRLIELPFAKKRPGTQFDLS